MTGAATASLTALLRGVIAPMSALRNHLPWAFASCYSTPLHSSRVSSPGPQLINNLEQINICGLFFWKCLPIFEGVEE